MSASPLRILEFSSHESNSVHSLQFSSRLFSRRLCIFHFPTRKSKSLWDEVGDAVTFNSPFWSKFNFGIGIDSSVVKTGFCASVPVRLAPMAGNLKGAGCTFVMQPVSSPFVVPVLNKACLMERVQSFSGVWEPPGTTTWIALGMKDFTTSPHFGGEAESVPPETSTAGASKRNVSK